MRITVCDIPTTDKELFFKKFLELNENIIYGGYGIVDNKVVFSHSIPYNSNLTFDKFAHIYSAFTFYFIQDIKKILK
jgi:hypothetical protein